MFSCDFNGCFFANAPLEVLTLSHTNSYLNNFVLLITNALVNGWLAVSTIAPLSFITRSYSAHNGSNGMIVSHLQAVVPYGKSHNIISIEPSGISFIISKQSPWCILFNSSTTHLRPSYLLQTHHPSSRLNILLAS